MTPLAIGGGPIQGTQNLIDTLCQAMGIVQKLLIFFYGEGKKAIQL